jgi:hypothetical protein
VVAASKGTKRFQYFDVKISFIAKRCKYAPILPPENFLLACTGAIIGTSSSFFIDLVGSAVSPPSSALGSQAASHSFQSSCLLGLYR